MDLVADFEPEILDRLVGDRGCDDGDVHVDAHMSRGSALLDVDDLARKRVACRNLHDRSFKLEKWTLPRFNYIACDIVRCQTGSSSMVALREMHADRRELSRGLHC